MEEAPTIFFLASSTYCSAAKGIIISAFFSKFFVVFKVAILSCCSKYSLTTALLKFSALRLINAAVLGCIPSFNMVSSKQTETRSETSLQNPASSK